MGYDPGISVPAYDVEGAKRLLAEAGLPEGFNITLHGPNDRYVNDDSIAQAVAQMWARIAVRTAVATSPASVFFTAGGVRDEHSVALTGWSTSTGEPDTHLSLMLATPAPERGRGTRLRPSHYSNPELDRMIDRALATIDTEAREKAYQEIIRIGYQRDLAVIPIHHQVNIWAMKRGITYRPTLSEQTRAVEFGLA